MHGLPPARAATFIRQLSELPLSADLQEYVLRQGPDLLDRLAVHNLSPQESARILGHMSQLGRLPIPKGLPVPEELHGLAEEVNMPHFLEGHTWDYLNPATRGKAKITTLWPQGTTPQNVSDYMQEALDKVHDGNRVLVDGEAVIVTLDSGVTILLRMREDANGVKKIVQFYPEAGPRLNTISKPDM